MCGVLIGQMSLLGGAMARSQVGPGGHQGGLLRSAQRWYFLGMLVVWLTIQVNIKVVLKAGLGVLVIGLVFV